MSIQLNPEQERIVHDALKTGKFHSVNEALDSALAFIRRESEPTPPLTRSQLAGQRIRELRKGATLGGITIKELIEEGRV